MSTTTIPTSGRLMLQRQGDVCIVEFLDNRIVDAQVIAAVEQELEQLLARTAVPKLVISFENVQHVSSAMLGVLIAAQRKAVAQHGNIRLVALNAQLMELFKLTSLHKVFKIFDSTDKALVKF
jgi:anti-sigma B factor antagonist